MKYQIKYSCGHEAEIQLFGPCKERKRKIEYYEQYGVCLDCYREQKEIEKSIGCQEVEMTYREYKTNFPDCKTKAGSYDGSKKTIIVYVPQEASNS